MSTQPAGPPPPHIPYKVLTQTKRRTLLNGVTWADAYEITFQGPNGAVSQIEVPADHYTPSYVDQLIEAELENIVGVQQLGPQPHPDNLAP